MVDADRNWFLSGHTIPFQQLMVVVGSTGSRSPNRPVGAMFPGPAR